MPGAYESIASTTVSTPVAFIEFTSIPSTYRTLEFRLVGRGSFSGIYDDCRITINGDTGSNYSWTARYNDNNGNFTYQRSSSDTGISSNYWTTGATALAGAFGVGIIQIVDYANTNKYKTGRSFSGFSQRSTAFLEQALSISSFNWRSTSAITSVKFDVSANAVEHTTFSLYGIKDS